MSIPAVDKLEISPDDGKESIGHKHRRERKELQAKIQSLKKSASKGDKKKRKEVLEEITKLEIELDKRQSEELNDINDEKSVTIATENLTLETDDTTYTNNVNENGKEEPQRLSKAQKRRDKKAREKKALEADILAQEELNKNGPRMLESRTIIKMLRERGLSLHTIPSDGDCLYNAIRHQLELKGHNCFSNITNPSDQISYLRNETANYILKNKDSLIYYMTNPDTGDLLSDEKFIKYCEQIRNTPAWGGQIEIKALANILKVSIEVLQATGPPTIQKGHENDSLKSEINLIITYHRHMYSLGEHYNSTKLLIEGDEEIDSEIIEN